MTAQTGTTKDLITTDELVSRAVALGPQLQERRLSAAKNRHIPEESIADLIDSEVLKACMPAKFGGFELPFGSHTDVAMELARYCGSTGWVAGIIGSHNWWLGKYQVEAQHEVWDKNPDALVAAAFASTKGSQAVQSAGGYTVSGKWLFCSGVDACGWTSLMAQVPRENQPPDLAMVLLPASDYTIEDVWYSPGMSATGSNNVLVNEVFVPAHRATLMSELNRKLSPGQMLNNGPTYRLPMLDVFGYSVAGPTLGAAKGALHNFLEGMRQRKALDNSRVAEFATQQVRVSEASAEIDAAQAIYDSDMAMMRNACIEDRELKQADLLRIKRNCAYIAQLSKRSASRVVEAMGAGGLNNSNPVHMAFSDAIAGASHRALNWDVHATAYGKVLFDLDVSAESEQARRQKEG